MLEGYIFLSENAITGQSVTNNFWEKMASRILILVEHSFFCGGGGEFGSRNDDTTDVISQICMVQGREYSYIINVS